MGGHALDYDDVADPIYGHPSIALYPALFAIAEAEGKSSAELLDAYVAGFEVAMAISTALPIRPHYSRGWHSTATVGVLAATAATSRLLGLSVETTKNALGIATSSASGSRQNFGTQTKPLHPGLAGAQRGDRGAARAKRVYRRHGNTRSATGIFRHVRRGEQSQRGATVARLPVVHP